MKTMVYIDGYNLYYGSLRKSSQKWLDVYQLFAAQILKPENRLMKVHYYTAPVLGRMCDDPESPQRQRTYLQALTKLYPNDVAIIQGKMIAMKQTRRHLDPPPDKVHVQHFEEKKSDVNIAVSMISDVLTGVCQQVVLCSNDSDLEPVLRMILKQKPEIKIGLVSPIRTNDHRHVSKDLMQHAHWHKFIKTSHLDASQLPDKIPHTSIRKPQAW
jgi:uncharacterized LabA/DUF88 family protein